MMVSSIYLLFTDVSYVIKLHICGTGFPTLTLSDYRNTFGFTPGTPTLIVTNAERVDFDTMGIFVFTVMATDVLNDSLVSNATVTINLQDYNDLSPVIHNDG